MKMIMCTLFMLLTSPLLAACNCADCDCGPNCECEVNVVVKYTPYYYNTPPRHGFHHRLGAAFRGAGWYFGGVVDRMAFGIGNTVVAPFDPYGHYHMGRRGQRFQQRKHR
jgi:hypothetical protein